MNQSNHPDQGDFCPVCAVRMTQETRYSVRVVVCPQCLGLWPERGELSRALEPERMRSGRQAIAEKARDCRPSG